MDANQIKDFMANRLRVGDFMLNGSETLDMGDLQALVDAAVAAERDLQRRVSPQCWGPGQFVVVATFRYCLGRQTYIVQECADWLTLHWPVIEQPVRNLIQRELEAAFVKDDAIRAAAGPGTGYKPLGWDCDRREWERVRSLWANAAVTGQGGAT